MCEQRHNPETCSPPAAGSRRILFAVSLAGSQERLDPTPRTVILLAGAAPVAIGPIVAAAQPGGITDEMLNINRQPHAVLPEQTIEITVGELNRVHRRRDGPPVQRGGRVIFRNEDRHAAQLGALRVGCRHRGHRHGSATDEVVFTTPEPGEYYYQCDVHPT